MGLKKDWGKSHGLNPVFYLEKNSYAYQIVLDSLIKLPIKRLDGNSWLDLQQSGEAIQKFLELAAFIKPRKGKSWQKESRSFRESSYKNSTIKEEITVFYNEREWRYIRKNYTNPFTKGKEGENLMRINFIPEFYFTENDKFSFKKFNTQNKKLEEHPLVFKYTHIKYLIVKNIQQLEELNKYIDNDLDATTREKATLQAKIMTKTQIKTDM